jgi:hypothetical protein
LSWLALPIYAARRVHLFSLKYGRTSVIEFSLQPVMLFLFV